MNRPLRRERTGVRRDDGVKRIRTDEIRYPGAKLPSLPPDLEARYRAEMAAETTGPDARLSPGVRDTGLAIEGRLARQQRAKRRATRQRAVIGVLVVAGLLLVAIGWRSASDKRAATAPLGGSASAADASRTTSSFLPALGHSEPPVVATAARPPAPEETPIFARYKSLVLRLPVAVKSLTELGFHQASYGYALPMTTPLPDAKLSSASDHRGTHRDISQQQTGPDAVLVGKVLRMWRPRPGRPDTAVDVGAKPGTDVLAPVTGTVIKVKKYKLYGRWDDYEIHIQPDGQPHLDVVMIHLTDVTCAPGDRVQAGVTRIAAVRKVSDKFYVQLSSYTKGGGNHVHVQVNDTTDPTYKGLEGAIVPTEGDSAEGPEATGSQSVR